MDQEKLFKQVRERYPGWNSALVSGYTHGVRDEAHRVLPSRDYRGTIREYARGYMWGFADARGPDILQLRDDDGQMLFSSLTIDYRWWEND